MVIEEQFARINSKRTPDPQRPHCTDSSSNGICDDNEAQNLDPNQCGDPCTSPIVINLRSGAYALSGADDPVRFDIDGDGSRRSRNRLERRRPGQRAGSTLARLAALDRRRPRCVSQSAELRSIAGSEVAALETEYHWMGRRDSSGNLFRYQALARVAGARRPIYDVFFRLVP